jgi:6-pyruvoyl-tetrahydropterin synthase
MLSKENYNKFKENYLYMLTNPKENTETWWKDKKNYTYRLLKWDSNRLFMIDTFYLIDHYNNIISNMFDFIIEDIINNKHVHEEECYFEITDENFDKFEMVLDFDNVNTIDKKCLDEYDINNIYCYPTNRFSYENTLGEEANRRGYYWVKKDTPKIKEVLIRKKQEEIQLLQDKIDVIEEKINLKQDELQELLYL